jgi:hypothetical protein
MTTAGQSHRCSSAFTVQDIEAAETQERESPLLRATLTGPTVFDTEDASAKCGCNPDSCGACTAS